MFKRFAIRSGVVIREIRREQIIIANGRKEKVYKTLHKSELHMENGYNEKFKFIIAVLQYDIILGLPWLEKHKVCVNWVSRMLFFQCGNRKISLQARGPFSHRPRNKNIIVINIEKLMINKNANVFVAYIMPKGKEGQNRIHKSSIHTILFPNMMMYL